MVSKCPPWCFAIAVANLLLSVVILVREGPLGKVTVWKSSPFPTKICGFLRFPAPSTCLNFQETGWKSAKICGFLRLSALSICHLRSVTLSAPWLLEQLQCRRSPASRPWSLFDMQPTTLAITCSDGAKVACSRRVPNTPKFAQPPRLSAAKWDSPKGPNLEKIQFQDLEIFNFAWKFQSRLKFSISTFRTPHKK